MRGPHHLEHCMAMAYLQQNSQGTCCKHKPPRLLSISMKSGSGGEKGFRNLHFIISGGSQSLGAAAGCGHPGAPGATLPTAARATSAESGSSCPWTLSGVCLAELLPSFTVATRESGTVSTWHLQPLQWEERSASSGGEFPQYRTGHKDPRWP